MSRNSETHFAFNPTNIDISRSTIKLDSNIKTSFNTGDIVPFYVQEVLPGDTHKVSTNKVVRLSTLVNPIMDNLYLDTYYFFVPNRLVWDHWKQMNGENTESAWVQTIEYEVPQVTSPAGGWQVGTIADYMGIPTGISNISVNAMPFRAYALIMNEWFRDENLCDPLHFNKDDTTVVGSNGSVYVNDVAKGGKPYKAAKYYDMYTGCLPSPQKGPDVPLPLGTSAPVNPNGYVTFLGNTSGATYSAYSPSSLAPNATTTMNIVNTGSISGTANEGVSFKPGSFTVDLTNATAATINQLRLAFQIQKLYERDARGGSRYIELLASHFGVTSPDSRQQRPEYLGGTRVPITINQVVQNSSTTSTSPQGNTTAYSLTVDSNYDFTHSFTEHGFIIGLAVVRYHHSYQQGLDRMWSRKDRFDYYWPVLANIGEQAVLNKEIYCDGSANDDMVFGYQEAWADYRFKPNKITGMLRSSYAQSLDNWHLGDDYSELPTLSEEWIMEDGSTVDRVLAVTSSIAHQFIADIYVEDTATRPMPLYSIPGLIDHH